MDQLLNDLLESALIAIVLSGGLLVLAVVAAFSDRLVYGRRPLRRTEHDQLDWRDGLDRFIGGTGLPRTAAALARENKEGAEASSRLAPDTTHGGRPHESHRQ